MRLPLALAALLPALIAPAAGWAGSFNGNWPLTISRAQHGNGAYCLTLAAGGLASLSGEGVGGTLPYGTYQVINHTLVATIDAEGETQNAGLVFAAPASNGSIGKGIFDEVYGGEAINTGVVSFGAKGGC